MCQAGHGVTAGGDGGGHEALANYALVVRARNELLPHVAALAVADALQPIQVVLQRHRLACAGAHTRA